MLAELAPVFSGAVKQPDVERAVIMAQVVYKDGRTDTLELSQTGATKAKAKAKPKSKAKGTPKKKRVKEAPIPVVVKELPPEQGTPIKEEEKPKKKKWGCPIVRKWVPEPEWVGETCYIVNGYYVPMGILKSDERYFWIGFVHTHKESLTPIRNEKGHRVVPPWSKKLRVLRTNENLRGEFLYSDRKAA